MTGISRQDDALSVLLALPGRRVPRWINDLLDMIGGCGVLEPTVAILDDGGASPFDDGQGLYARWCAWDRRLFRSKLESGLPVDELVTVDDARLSEHGMLFLESSKDDLGRQLNFRPDVVIWLAADRPPPAIIGLAAYGTWCLTNLLSRAAGFAEFVDARAIVACSVLRFGESPPADRVLATTNASADRLSMTRHRQSMRSKDVALLYTLLKRVRLDPTIAESAAELPPGSPAAAGAPGWLAMMVGLTRLYFRYVRNRVTSHRTYCQWQLAIRRGGHRLSQEGLETLSPPHRGFYADPFVAVRDGRTALFLEELPEDSSRGIIVVMDLEDNGGPGQPRTVVERDYHLSYPFLFEYQGDLFMIPESAEGGQVEALRCTGFPDSWTPHAVLLNDVKAYDSTLIQHDGLWWLFATIKRDGVSSEDELHVYFADEPFAEWRPHPLNPVNIDVCSARPAGAMYREDGRLYRPGQDCSVRYGYAISIREITRLSPTEYEECTVEHIEPEWLPGSLGTHTVNADGEWVVYDAYVRKRH